MPWRLVGRIKVMNCGALDAVVRQPFAIKTLGTGNSGVLAWKRVPKDMN